MRTVNAELIPPLSSTRANRLIINDLIRRAACLAASLFGLFGLRTGGRRAQLSHPSAANCHAFLIVFLLFFGVDLSKPSAVGRSGRRAATRVWSVRSSPRAIFFDLFSRTSDDTLFARAGVPHETIRQD
ncbi:hypothetical protein RGR602_CH02602 [Rhizobium gallicum bv. gallicum R602sp]|uniref:Uncharacterized protein n=1 Tax=Rhizobium gallicum bv. gallicum R602sp TaxID=1041138 RepID=A0A0B4X1W1_9HYPH|nr:hypothetical protein RGR602_CH02602 [Rhizobium gallicum bv. gallicum R602sp]